MVNSNKLDWIWNQQHANICQQIGFFIYATNISPKSMYLKFNSQSQWRQIKIQFNFDISRIRECVHTFKFLLGSQKLKFMDHTLESHCIIPVLVITKLTWSSARNASFVWSLKCATSPNGKSKLPGISSEMPSSKTAPLSRASTPPESSSKMAFLR